VSDNDWISPELVLVDPELRARLLARYAAESQREAEVQRALLLPAHSSALTGVLVRPAALPEVGEAAAADATGPPPDQPTAERSKLGQPALESARADQQTVEPHTAIIRPPEPAATQVTRGEPTGGAIRGRAGRRFRPSTIVFAVAALFLLVTGLLPPKDAPSFADSSDRVHVAIAWQSVAGSRLYVVDILDRGSVVWTDLVRGPSLDRELDLPGGRTYVWRVYTVTLPTQRSGSERPIARGTLAVD
jgi:hypothetical protein